MATLDGTTIGFIGLGLMGAPMARNLARAGAEMVIYNRSRAKVEALAADGMTPAESPREAAERAEVVVLMVTDTPAVERVMEGPDGVLEALRPGLLVIDMGTTRVATTRRLAEAVRAGGGEFVDAPVSGGEVGAVEGTLTIMAGGSDAAFARARPLFEAMGRNINHMGEVGAGQVTKAANQVIVGMTLDAVAEALALAKHAGVDPGRVRRALTGGFADSRILELHGARMVDGAFEPGGRAEVQRKDMAQALELAQQIGLDLPGLARNLELWDAMLARGWGGLDHSAIFKLIDEG